VTRRPPDGPLRIAHRGDARAATENTLAALLAAIRLPTCDGVEFDVRTSADGVPVLLHDETLERVFGRPERVDAMAADALEVVGVPALSTVLAALPHHAFLDIELKGKHDRAVVEVMAAGRGPALQRAAVSSFDPSTLERIAGLVPSWPRWLNAWDLEPFTIATAVELECRGIAVEWHAIDGPPAVVRVRTAGLELATWTIRRRPTADRLARLGVDVLCVEGPALDGPTGPLEGGAA
jgi:glycerophosphoryl diester phosphodiesterase